MNETPPERLAFSRNLRRARKAAGLRQADITRATGLAQSFVSLVECDRSLLSLDTAAVLARAVGVLLWQLLRGDVSG